jgi:CRP/FNR family transcriptional regulator
MATYPAQSDPYPALRSCRLWRTASDEAVRALAAGARVESVRRGETLATEGEAAERFGVVVTGRVRVYHLQADGRTLTLETLGSGEPFAIVAALAGGRYPAHADAATDATIAWLDRAALDVPGRLAAYLFQRSLAAGEATPEGLVVPLGMTKTELASSLGTVPETLSRAFARLRDDGVLAVRGTKVVVLDVGALARLGSGYGET